MTIAVVDMAGSTLVKDALRAITDGVPLIKDDDVALLAQTLNMVRLRDLLSTHGEPWPSLSWTLGGAPLLEALKLLASCLGRLRDLSATRDDADGVSRFGRLETLVQMDHDRLAARAAGKQTTEPR